jgi:long-chain fatty acid transport protein
LPPACSWATAWIWAWPSSARAELLASDSQLNGQFGAFTVNTPGGEVNSGSEYFPIPYVAKSWALENDRAISLLFYGRGGMNTDYNGGSATFDPDGPGPAPVMTCPAPSAQARRV